MTSVGNSDASWPSSAAVFGASGGIGSAIVSALQERGVGKIYAGARSSGVSSSIITPFAFDLTDEASIAASADLMCDDPPDLVLVTTGVLTLSSGTGPERSLKRLDQAAMAKVFALNTIGPALIAKHMLPLMSRTDRWIFAALSARVGSISDNGLGGWHSYRASKAALNMLLKNFALEMGRTHKHGTVVGLHPGTVDTSLSKPFQKGLPEGQLSSGETSANHLLDVLAGLGPEHSGCVFDWKGEQIPA
jgi:NAD(P)-dependent dehydrogenase (short-subunit alcohol dehydrogenase family)